MLYIVGLCEMTRLRCLSQLINWDYDIKEKLLIAPALQPTKLM